MLDIDVIEECKEGSSWSSLCILKRKADKSYRFVTDFRRVNEVTKTDTYPISRVDDCIDNVGNAVFVSKFDLMKGYWQIPLTGRAKEISTFSTSRGLFSYKVIPFGLKNSAATFQRMMNKIIAGLLGTGCYIDDIVVYSMTWESHLELFERLLEFGLTINLSKYEFGQATINYLGCVVGNEEVAPIQSKVQGIFDFKIPENKKKTHEIPRHGFLLQKIL